MDTPTILISKHMMDEYGRQFSGAARNATLLQFADLADMVAKLPDVDAACVMGELTWECDGRRVGDIIVEDCPRLKWVQTASAGVDKFMPRELAARGIALTNGSGAAAPAIAEHVVSMMFAFARGLVGYVRNHAGRKWNPDAGMPIMELGGKTLGIYGVGRIGTELAMRANALGMKVYGANLPARPTPDFMAALWPTTRLKDLLRIADFFVVCVPLTDATRHLFGAAEFSLMKSSAYFFNIGRGGTVDQDALIAALKAGEVAGAGLDVTTPEPLPDESPLWDLPNVILTPHMAGGSVESGHRAIAIVLENVRRYAAGEPLLNVVDIALV